MTNKEYERLTYRPRKGGKVCCLTPNGTSQDLAKRLYALEEMIGNGTLVFLPCKVGDTFWCLADYGMEYVVTRHTVQEIRILDDVIYLYDENDGEYDTNDLILFTTKEAAEKALEELRK